MASKKYLVRAKLNVDAPSKKVTLPLEIGQFSLDWSPNYELWLVKLGFCSPEDIGKPLLPENRDFPFSSFYIDTDIEVDSENGRYRVADERLDLLEAAFRLIAEGDVSIRRHKMWERGAQLEEDTPAFAPHLWREFQVRPEPQPLYDRKPYELTDATLSKVRQFMGDFWQVIQKKPMPLFVAISRFSSSYEKRDLSDRLVELMVAMEALFGEPHEATYKIALRGSCFNYPPGEARQKAFRTIREIYDERSNIVHGEKLNTKLDCKRIDQFEEIVRQSILRFLKLHKRGMLTVPPSKLASELDRLLFFSEEQQYLWQE